ncbi:MAG: hypothetical protein HQL50_08795 [Magnetococcales bacterium]|nr:hypothetical protein [Magnetococcales bacterium]
MKTRSHITSSWMAAVSFISLLALCLLAVPTGAIAASKDGALVITSNKLVMDDKRQSAIFSGKVKVRQGPMKLDADRMTVFYAKGKKQGGKGQVREIRAEGNVVIQQGKNRGTAFRALYDVNANTIRLLGNPKGGAQKKASIHRDTDHLMGQKILLKLAKDKTIAHMSVEGGKKQRVSARINSSGVLETAPAEKK